MKELNSNTILTYLEATVLTEANLRFTAVTKTYTFYKGCNPFEMDLKLAIVFLTHISMHKVMHRH